MELFVKKVPATERDYAQSLLNQVRVGDPRMHACGTAIRVKPMP